MINKHGVVTKIAENLILLRLVIEQSITNANQTYLRIRLIGWIGKLSICYEFASDQQGAHASKILF